MIENDRQLLATLEYLAKWANALEGIRLQEEASSPNIFSQSALGPITEIRKGLEEMRCYVQSGLPDPEDLKAS